MADSLSIMSLARGFARDPVARGRSDCCWWKTTAASDSRSSDMLTDEGFDVTTAVNGREALHELRQAAAPDVIVLDLMMPVMDGWEFRVEQRADPVLAEHPAGGDVRRPQRQGARRSPPTATSASRSTSPRCCASCTSVVGQAAQQRLRGRRSPGGAGDAALRHRARDQQPPHLHHRQSADAGRASSALDGRRGASCGAGQQTPRGRRAHTQAGQAGADGRARPRASSASAAVDAARRRCTTALALTENAGRAPGHLSSGTTRTSDGSTSRGPTTNARAAVRQPADERRAGDPRGARDRELGPRQHARAARPARGLGRDRRHRARASRSRSTSGSSSRSSPPDRSGRGPGSASRSAAASSRALGGEIAFRGDDRRGTTFRVVLPTTTRPGMRPPHPRVVPGSGAPATVVLFMRLTPSSRLRCSRRRPMAAPTSVTGMFGFCRRQLRRYQSQQRGNKWERDSTSAICPTRHRAGPARPVRRHRHRDGRQDRH